MGRYFGTDGFRGEAGIDLTADHAYKVGRFLGWYYNALRERNGNNEPARIVIGKDTRRSSYMFEYSLVAGLTASGADAYLLHVTTTPSVAYIARVDDFDCGIMISASHNADAVLTQAAETASAKPVSDDAVPPTKRIDELSLSDQEKLVAIMEAGCDEVSDIDDLINLTFNLDCYDIMPGINDESDLGYYYAHEAGIYSEKDLGPLANYIDYERYGRDIAMDEQGRFTDEGYVRVASERWDRQFNGELDDIPDEYRITGSGEATERDSTIAVLVVEPGKEPYVKEIDSGLESLQHEVGGYIEAIYPYEDPVALVCNEEGKLEGLPLNRALRDEDGDIYDVVAGTFLVVGLTDDSFGSLTVEQMQKFSDLFKVPEQFVKLGDKIVAIPMISKEQQKQESIEQKDFEMNADTSGLTVAGHIGTWHTIDQHEVGGHSFYLMEHDTYGDEAACIIVDERGKLVLDDVYNGFDDDTLRLLDLEVKEVPEMPDPALSVQDMKDYGYAWAGVLPAGQEAAEKALEKGCEVYRLYSDNTEGLCVDAKEIADHAAKGGMLGISKESWMAALEKENYLKAAEMSMEDDYGMIDGIINNGPKEDKTLDAKAPETREKSSIMDRLKAAKGVKQKECCPPKKHKGEIEL